MKKCLQFAITLLFCCLAFSCINYSPDSTPDGSVDDAAIGVPDEPADEDEEWRPDLPGVVVTGRLWPWPNPLLFGHDDDGYHIQELAISFSNIGTQDVAIEDLSLSGDPVFSFVDDELDSYMPEEIGGGDCNHGAGFGTLIRLDSAPTGISSATILVQTSDPQSPSLEIPVIYHPKLVISSFHLTDGLDFVPSVKPNPIRFNPDPAIGVQTIEMCISVMAMFEKPRLMNVYTIGDAFTVSDLKDSSGDPVSLPTDDLIEGPSLESATVSFNPTSDIPEGGFLVFEFQLGSGQMVTLRVPILVELN